MDPVNGEIRGWFPRAGDYAARITATNAAGSSAATIAFRVSAEAWDARVHAPAKAAAGVPAEIAFAAFDSEGTLDFIDVSDLTTGKVLERLPAGEGEKSTWQGVCRPTLLGPGVHAVVLRFVRFRPGGAGSYSFMDRECDVEVSP
jgi:hypothetical protein